MREIVEIFFTTRSIFECSLRRQTKQTNKNNNQWQMWLQKLCPGKKARRTGVIFLWKPYRFPLAVMLPFIFTKLIHIKAQQCFSWKCIHSSFKKYFFGICDGPHKFKALGVQDSSFPGIALYNRTFCNDGNVPQLCCPIW